MSFSIKKLKQKYFAQSADLRVEAQKASSYAAFKEAQLFQRFKSFYKELVVQLGLWPELKELNFEPYTYDESYKEIEKRCDSWTYLAYPKQEDNKKIKIPEPQFSRWIEHLIVLIDDTIETIGESKVKEFMSGFDSTEGIIVGDNTCGNCPTGEWEEVTGEPPFHPGCHCDVEWYGDDISDLPFGEEDIPDDIREDLERSDAL